ncbi:hypothetical protein ACR6C2_40235 [Streptomyces sp. INA 01156]
MWNVSQAGSLPRPWFHQSLYQPFQPASGITTRTSRRLSVCATSVIAVHEV